MEAEQATRAVSSPSSVLLSVDIVVPVFNEGSILENLYRRLCQAVEALPQRFRFWFVNDGSTDDTAAVLAALAAQDPRLEVIELSRNFGHQAAITAGLDRATGDHVITLDGDGEHPPELIPQMLELASQGFEVVLTQRTDPLKAGVFKKTSADLFYSLINRISDTQIIRGCGDYRLLSRKVVAELCKMRETHRFLRGMVPWMGFRTAILPYQPAPRLGGKTKYTLPKMVRLAFAAVLSFSLAPLYLIGSLGGLFLLLAFVDLIYLLARRMAASTAPPAAWDNPLVFFILLIGGLILVALGIIGIYVGYILQEVKQRPIYIVRHSTDGRTGSENHDL